MPPNPGLNDQVLLDIGHVMREFPQPWWVAGGWAIDLYLGHQSRAHQDIDVAVLRRDQRALRRHFQGWRFTKVVSSVSLPWPEQEQLDLPIHQVYAANGAARLEFLLNEAMGDTWFFRRNKSVSAPIECITRRSATGIPYLSPEVVLLYKAKSPRDHDHADFQSVLPNLEPSARTWLASALQICHPSHEWLVHLRAYDR